MTELKTKPSSLIKQDRVLPSAQSITTHKKGLIQSDRHDSIPTKRKNTHQNKFKNQDATIKLSIQTKQELELIMKAEDIKFGYEMIETLIDSYVTNEFTAEQQRSFRSLKNLIN